MISTGGCEVLNFGQFEIFTFEVGYPTNWHEDMQKLMHPSWMDMLYCGSCHCQHVNMCRIFSYLPSPNPTI